MRRYKLIVHRPVVLREIWYAEATSAVEAQTLFDIGLADFYSQDEDVSEDPVIQSVEIIPGPDPDIDMDEGL